MSAQRYIYRWNRQGRKGQACEVTARSKPDHPDAQSLAFGTPARPRFNSICVRFEADGYTMVTSGNAIRKAAP
ncbi:hypothetical protein [Hoeflea sp.]|uniref:hypothetical protein n=1 Tax=Hoeflea sp. TaxID=1940281 RepID=UPI003748C358